MQSNRMVTWLASNETALENREHWLKDSRGNVIGTIEEIRLRKTAISCETNVGNEDCHVPLCTPKAFH